MYSHGRAKISNFLNRLLHEFLGLMPAINLTIFFCKKNTFLLFDELPKKLFHTSLRSENRQNTPLSGYNVGFGVGALTCVLDNSAITDD
jgi:hypothetical protein